MTRSIFLISVVAALAASALGQSILNKDPDAARFVTSDIDLFWRAYDKATPANDLVVYRDEYLEKGSEGLKEFNTLRIGSSCNLLSSIERSRDYYEALREPSLRVKTFEPQVRASFRRLQELYPDAVFPDVYFVIGRMSSAGTLSPKGLYVGVDMFGANKPGITDGLSDWHRAVIGPIERIPVVVVHESIHYQQKYPSDTPRTLLAAAINEGAADFIAALATGGNINEHLHTYADPIEEELWKEFEKEMDGTKISNWLYQGEEAKDRPADLGYYMGYKIAESYYKHADDKKAAVREILEIKDFKAFLEKSRYAEKSN